MIRDLDVKTDPVRILGIHSANKLPDECLPKLLMPDPKKKGNHVVNPLFVVNRVMIQETDMAMGAFARGTAELFLLMNHRFGTPEQRWAWLKQMTEDMKTQASAKGLEDLTAWVPPDMEKSFGDRMRELGFQKSPWPSYTLLL